MSSRSDLFSPLLVLNERRLHLDAPTLFVSLTPLHTARLKHRLKISNSIHQAHPRPLEPPPTVIHIATRTSSRRCHLTFLTFNWSQNDPGVVVRYHVGVAVFGLVHFQVGVLPGELLTGVDGLGGERQQTATR